MHPILNVAVRAARRGGNILLRYIEHIGDLEITVKGTRDFVSEVDRTAEREIIDVIRTSYPSHGILAEESGAQPGDDFIWVIDPLDGTNNYLHGLPHFCISIGVKERGRLQHGVIYDPLREELFVTSRGGGAMLNNRRIRVGRRQHFDDALIGLGFTPSQGDFAKAYLTIHRSLTEDTVLRHSGSAALDLAYVAAGRLDGFCQLGLSEWGMAAGALLIREAGGMVAAPDGGEKFLELGQIVAGSPKLFKTLLRRVHRGLKEANLTEG